MLKFIELKRIIKCSNMNKKGMKAMNTLSLGEKIKSLRKKAGMTQRQLADAIPISFSTFRRWETEEYKPNVKEISRLAEVLNVSPYELMESSNVPEREYSEITRTQSAEGTNIPDPNMSYWGGVIDNIRKVIMRGDLNEIALIYPLLKSGCEMLAEIRNAAMNDENSNFHHVDIRQNNFGRDATVNLGGV